MTKTRIEETRNAYTLNKKDVLRAISYWLREQKNELAYYDDGSTIEIIGEDGVTVSYLINSKEEEVKLSND